MQLYNKKGNEIFSSSVKIDINGIEIDSINASTTNIINNDGMDIVDKATNNSLFSVTKIELQQEVEVFMWIILQMDIHFYGVGISL
ncbi:hypothetical protein Q5M85_21230 [Paraclostridium bifermentans]|nr:hypothetical protein [Paraclostridium bifermentans]